MLTLRVGSGQIFGSLDVYRDIDSRLAELNMAIDEALLETVDRPSIRFYRWNHPALSFGYFGKFSDVTRHAPERDIVRRWTGGGIVFHGTDLTYSIVIPANDPSFSESAMSIYETTHDAIRTALAATGKNAELAKAAAPKISDSCFANAVRADVLWSGKKIAGAAQRRTRRGLLQQGSIQNVELAPSFESEFCAQLSLNCREGKLDAHLLQRAQQIAQEKYATTAWLRRQ